MRLSSNANINHVLQVCVRTSDMRVSERTCIMPISLRGHTVLYNDLSNEVSNLTDGFFLCVGCFTSTVWHYDLIVQSEGEIVIEIKIDVSRLLQFVYEILIESVVSSLYCDFFFING